MNPRILVLTLLVGAFGCKTDEDRCHEAQTAAQQAWSAYIDVSTERKPAVAKRLSNAHLAMLQMSRSLGAAATAETNQLYDRGSAWQRHYEVALTQACRRDPDCAVVEKERDHAKADADTIEQRIALATSARKAAVTDPESAWSAAKEVEVEPTRPTSVAADLASKTAADTCGVDRGL
jgi:hypothetical protein